MTDQPIDAAAPPLPDIRAWLDRMAEVLPPATLDELGPAEQAALLDLARIAAHQSHRSAAPITTYLIGLTVAGLPRSVRLERLQSLARILEEGSIRP